MQLHFPWQMIMRALLWLQPIASTDPNSSFKNLIFLGSHASKALPESFPFYCDLFKPSTLHQYEKASQDNRKQIITEFQTLLHSCFTFTFSGSWSSVLDVLTSVFKVKLIPWARFVDEGMSLSTVARVLYLCIFSLIKYRKSVIWKHTKILSISWCVTMKIHCLRKTKELKSHSCIAIQEIRTHSNYFRVYIRGSTFPSESLFSFLIESVCNLKTSRFCSDLFLQGETQIFPWGQQTTELGDIYTAQHYLEPLLATYWNKGI